MLSSFGKNIRVTIYGGSHEAQIGVDVDGIPGGMTVDLKRLQSFLNRRAPGSNMFSTPRKEADQPIFTGGLTRIGLGAQQASSAESDHGAPRASITEADRFGSLFITDGGRISAYIENTDRRPGDYRGLANTPRPGHADFTAGIKYGGEINMSGGGPFSGRMTAPLCIAGGIALQILEEKGIYIGAHISSIHGIEDMLFDWCSVCPEDLKALTSMDFPVISAEAGEKMKAEILRVAAASDSVGGTVECCALNLPAGLGGPMYDGIESILSPIFFGIPAVKGVEFGRGFGSALLLGSENNDGFYVDNSGASPCIKTVTNNHGGILGGISSGMPLIARAAFKPTPSIGREQQTVDLSAMKETSLELGGRHDPCVVLRAVPAVEAAMALGLLDLIIS